MPETLNKDSNNIKCKEFIYEKYQYVDFLYLDLETRCISASALYNVSHANTTKNEAISI
ncbi:MAG: hypothetical protein ACJATI_000372 [Halioglobus sp.]|jgi:hypothetical protein